MYRTYNEYDDEGNITFPCSCCRRAAKKKIITKSKEPKKPNVKFFDAKIEHIKEEKSSNLCVIL